jgi:hypothetical protein
VSNDSSKELTTRQFCMLVFASAVVALGIFIIALGTFGNAIINELSVFGYGDAQIRTDNKMASDFASAVKSDIAYESVRTWGITGESEKFISSFIIASASLDGKWRNAYRIKSSGAGHKVIMQATKISGNASFAGEISLDGTEATNPKFDSVIEFDTRDGNAVISGRVYNQTAGRPATMQELDLVGKYILRHHLNVSLPAITPENWLPSCSEYDKDLIKDPTAPGLYIAPLNNSKYNYTWNGLQIIPVLNTSTKR